MQFFLDNVANKMVILTHLKDSFRFVLKFMPFGGSFGGFNGRIGSEDGTFDILDLPSDLIFVVLVDGSSSDESLDLSQGGFLAGWRSLDLSHQ